MGREERREGESGVRLFTAKIMRRTWHSPLFDFICILSGEHNLVCLSSVKNDQSFGSAHSLAHSSISSSTLDSYTLIMALIKLLGFGSKETIYYE